MKVTEVERKESTKHCCGNGWTQKNSAEHEGYAGALIGKRIAENNTTNADRGVNGLLERIVEAGNLNRAYKRVKRNKGAGGVDGMKVDELLQYLKDNGKEIRESIVDGRYRPQPVRRVEIPKENGKKRKLGIPTAVDRVIQQAVAKTTGLRRITKEILAKRGLISCVDYYLNGTAVCRTARTVV